MKSESEVVLLAPQPAAPVCDVIVVLAVVAPALGIRLMLADDVSAARKLIDCC